MEPSHTAQEILDAGGWEALDITQVDHLTEEQRRAVMDVAYMYQSVFDGSEAGKAVLRDLVECYYVQTPVAQPGEDGITIGIRQGAQNVVRRILHFLALARTGGRGGR